MSKGRKLAKKRERLASWQEVVKKSSTRGKFLDSDLEYDLQPSRSRAGMALDSISRGMPGNEEEDP